MVSSLAWHDRWLIGIEKLDADHGQLVALFNRLVETGADLGGAPTATGPAPNGDRVAAEQLARLQGLIEALRQHFRAEEEFLRGIDYPGHPEHKSEHALHLAELVDLYRQLETAQMAGQPRQIDDEHLDFMKGWLLNHIAEDQRFARYYFEQLGIGAAEDHRRGRQATRARPQRPAAEPPPSEPP